MTRLDGKVAWITGAGSGIGQAVATAFADAGCAVVLTGRRQEALDQTAETIAAKGGQCVTIAGDLTRPETVDAVVARIEAELGRLDILVNNAGGNIVERAWKDLTPASIDGLISGNLSAALYCAAAAMHPMRKAQQGQLIHIASWAGKFIHPVSGPAYTAAKHAVVAMSQSINMEEYRNGIRSTAILPAEVATSILDKRPAPPSAEERAAMLQPADLAELALFIVSQPASVCLNEVVISPRLNKFYER
jgi:NADP-dependent 3-hydroxy acid dehydrogenase YdfG